MAYSAFSAAFFAAFADFLALTVALFAALANFTEIDAFFKATEAFLAETSAFLTAIIAAFSKSLFFPPNLSAHSFALNFYSSVAWGSF